MGDILDPLHSTRWLDTMPGDADYIRPWSDPSNPLYAPKLLKVTRAILEMNKESTAILRQCASGELISMPPATKKGKPDRRTKTRIPIKVRIHYMIGNHDWYYHLKGGAFDQIRQEVSIPAMEYDLKEVWDGISEEFLQLDYVRQADKAFQFDIVDAMQLMIKISGTASFSTIDDAVIWFRNKMWEGEHSFAVHALQEPAFLNETARYIVYGHTHHYEVVPLDSTLNLNQSQLYFNSGTWHPYYGLAIKNLKAERFVPYQAMTYLTFYTADEYDGRHFETWFGAYA